MSKYVVETFYTCTFKIVHKLDELNEKKFSELENRNDGEVQIIDVKLNNRKTKKISNKNNFKDTQKKILTKDIPNISSTIKETIVSSEKYKDTNEPDSKNANSKSANSENANSKNANSKNADSKNAAWTSRGTHQKTMENMLFCAAPAGRHFLLSAQSDN